MKLLAGVRIKMMEAVAPRIALHQFHIDHALLDHGLRSFLIILALLFFLLAIQAYRLVIVNRKDPLIFWRQRLLASRALRRTAQLLFPCHCHHTSSSSIPGLAPLRHQKSVFMLLQNRARKLQILLFLLDPIERIWILTKTSHVI
jgi:hypothetical protein